VKKFSFGFFLNTHNFPGKPGKINKLKGGEKRIGLYFDPSFWFWLLSLLSEVLQEEFFVCNPNKIHLFDKETQKNIR